MLTNQRLRHPFQPARSLVLASEASLSPSVFVTDPIFALGKNMIRNYTRDQFFLYNNIKKAKIWGWRDDWPCMILQYHNPHSQQPIAFCSPTVLSPHEWPWAYQSDPAHFQHSAFGYSTTMPNVLLCYATLMDI